MTDGPVTESEELIGATAAAELLNVSKATVIRRIHSGTIPIVGQVDGKGEFVIRASVITALVETGAVSDRP